MNSCRNCGTGVSSLAVRAATAPSEVEMNGSAERRRELWPKCAGAVALALTMMMVACSGDELGAGGTFSCSSSFPSADGGARPPGVCVEGTGASIQDVENNRQKCASEGNTFSDGPCTRGGAVGGCRVTHAGVAITTWYYAGAGTTAADVQQICTGLAGVGAPDTTIEFVPP